MDDKKENTKIQIEKDSLMGKKGIVVLPSDFQGIDWISKAKALNLNTIGLHSGGGPNHDVLKTLDEYASKAFQQKVIDAGLDLEYENHVPNMFLPRTLFNEHPEYFPLNYMDSSRLIEGNWCISNPEVRELILTNAMNLADILKPSTNRHYFWSADYSGGWCHCSDCSKLTAMEQNLKSINLIASKMRSVNPKAEIAYLAYLNQHAIPCKVTPAEGVFLEFAPIFRCPIHPINDPDCAVNQILWKSLKRNLEIFDAAETHVLEYWLDASYFSKWERPAKKIYFFPDVLRRDLEAYMSLGIRNFTSFAAWIDGEYIAKFGDEDIENYGKILNEFSD